MKSACKPSILNVGQKQYHFYAAISGETSLLSTNSGRIFSINPVTKTKLILPGRRLGTHVIENLLCSGPRFLFHKDVCRC
jgi:hypothetical protein